MRHLVYSCAMVCGSLLVAVACGSDDPKRHARDDAAAGQGGEGLVAVAGSPAVSMGGAGDDSFVSTCEVSGKVVMPSVDQEPIYSACRGARLQVELSATTDGTDPKFTCCGVSNAKPAWGTDLFGSFNQLGGGNFVFEVTRDATLGPQSLSIGCADGPVANVIQLNVTEEVPPAVKSASASVVQGEPMAVVGTGLKTVTFVTAFDTGGVAYECVIDSQTDTSLSCHFGADVPVGVGYRLRVGNEACGFAPVQPTFDIAAAP